MADDTMAAPTDTAPAAPDTSDSGGMDTNELCVPLSALAQSAEDDRMENPAVGDKVQAMVEGEVSRIEGDNAYVTMTAVNGQEIAPKESEPTDAQQFSDLQGMAQNMPERT